MKQILQLTLVGFLVSINSFAQEFTRIEDIAGIDHLHVDEFIMGGGAAFFDYDNDGDLDIYVTGGANYDKLYRNDGDETFTDVSIAAGLEATDTIATNGVCTGDIDNDGDRDIFVTTGVEDMNLLYENQGDGTFINIAEEAGIIEATWSTSVTMGDYNMDGFLDIYVMNYVEIFGFPGVPFYEQIEETKENFFYMNNGDNTFTQIAGLVNVNNSGAGLAVAFTDFDNDNDVDIYVANDFGGFYEPNAMLQNEYPLNEFTDVAELTGSDAGINAMGVAIGDYDNDLDFDYYISNMAANVFYENTDNEFTDVTVETNTLCSDLVSWGDFFFDFDNNEKLDLFVANGGVLMQAEYLNEANTIFVAGEDDNIFTESQDYTGQVDSAISRGAIYGDFDEDGDLDIFVVNMSNDPSSTSKSYLLRNDNNNGLAWLQVETEGSSNNKDGFGTKVRVYYNGNSLIREVSGGSSYQSQNSSILHFGLGETAIIDSMEVIWLGGYTQMIYSISPNQTIHIKEDNFYNFSQTTICEGDSILYNGEWISEEMTYYDTVSTSEGADNVMAMTLLTTPFFYEEVDVTINQGDSILLEGEYQTSEGVYTDTYTSSGGCDSTVVTTLSIDISSAISELDKSNLSIYPNPSNGEFSINFSQEVFVNEIEVYSIIGKKVFAERIENFIDIYTLNLEDQQEGVYLISIRSNDEIQTIKVIINK